MIKWKYEVERTRKAIHLCIHGICNPWDYGYVMMYGYLRYKGCVFRITSPSVLYLHDTSYLSIHPPTHPLTLLMITSKD